MKTTLFKLVGAVALAAITTTPSDALGVSSDPTCATYPYVNLGYGEVNPFGTCSGHGKCVDTNVTTTATTREYICLCDEGWTGRSDWIDGDGYDCGVNILAVQAMWGVNVFITLFLLAKSIPYIQHRLENTRKVKDTMKKKGKEYSIKNNRGLLAMYCFFGICTPAQLVMGIYRITNTQVRVGLDLLPTLLFCALKFGLYMTSWLFSPALLAAVLRGQKSMDRIVKMNDRFSLALSLVAIVLGCLALINIASADQNGSQNESINIITYAAYMLGITAQMVCYAAQAAIVRSKVVHELTKSHSMTGRPETLILRSRLSDVQGEIVRQAGSQMIPYLVLFLFPMLWTKHDYALPLTWIAVPIIGFKVAKSSDSRMKSSTSQAGGSGRGGTVLSKASHFVRSAQGAGRSRAPTVESQASHNEVTSEHYTGTWAQAYVRSTGSTKMITSNQSIKLGFPTSSGV